MASHREKIIRELISTEVTYVNSLTWLQENFREPLKQGHIITEEQDQTIFLNSLAILNLHAPLLEKLEKAMEEAEKEHKIESVCIGKILSDLIPWLRMYTAYINGTQEGAELVDKLNKTDDNFRYALIGCCAEIFSGVMGISSLRQVPVQRIPRYVLLLKDLLKHTDETHPDFQDLNNALNGFQQIATEINEKKRSHENQAKIQVYDETIKGNRHLLLEDCPEQQSHQWKKTRVTTATTCGNLGCKSLIGFGKKYYKCDVCHIVCHKVCASEMPHNCSQFPSLIKYNRILLRDGMLRSTRVHMSTGKKMNAEQTTNLILFNDCLAVCFIGPGDTLELDAVIWWFSVGSNRKAVVNISSQDGATFSVTSPTNGDIYSFICDSSLAQQEWVNNITKAMAEWLISYKARNPSDAAEKKRSSNIILACQTNMFSIVHTVPVFSAKGKTFTAFVIDFTYQNKEHTTIKRYSEFDKLHKRLKHALPKADIPSLPPKRFLKGNTDANFVKNRCARLALFLNRLVEQVPESLQLPCFKEFLFEDEEDDEADAPDVIESNAPLFERSSPQTISMPVIPKNTMGNAASVPKTDFRTTGWEGGITRQRATQNKMGTHRRGPQRANRRISLLTPSPFRRGSIIEPLTKGIQLEQGDAVTIISENKEENTCVIFLNGEYQTIPRDSIKIVS